MAIWGLAAVAILVGTVLQRVSGTGVGLVCAPILALLLGSAQGVLVTNATTTVSGFLIMLAVRRDIDWRRAGAICLAAVPGAILGAFVVRELSPSWLQVVLGAVVLTGVLVTVTLPRLPEVRGRGPMALAGVIGGLFNTTAGVAAPAMVIYSRLSRWEHRSFAATLQPIFMTMGALSVVTKTALGAAPTTPPWWFPIVVVLTVLAGARLGGLLVTRVSTDHARTLALVLAGTGGAVTLVRGLTAL
ncbi:sulfite exporter TauE/SafE family protein [Mobilicoccus caccae]|uniref:Probable membrane transporter protein n=1 Tax=Mobilicoccus caccae TaxID=1859295 RepID=A0ABQ6IW05_9MICO|nr:sulfite exporter TauE/SafE family protein [Mobilicoccus caccae]GMA41659.1 permease [Mobilicoccus caccae]